MSVAVDATPIERRGTVYVKRDDLYEFAGAPGGKARTRAAIRAVGRRLPILGVVVGADPRRRLDRYAPFWADMVDLIPAGLPYDRPAPVTALNGLGLDPIYEAKCLPFLCDGDLLWVVGLRPSVA